MTKSPRTLLASRRRVLARLTCVLAVSVATGLAADPGSAAAFPYPLDFATEGQGAGEVYFPSASAVDQSNGTVWIADEGNHRVDAFSGAGAFQRAFGFGVLNGAEQLQVCTTFCLSGTLNAGGPAPGEVYPEAVAVDDKTHDVYVGDRNESRIEKYGPSGELLWLIGGGVDKGKKGKLEPGNRCTEAAIEKEHEECGEGTPGPGAGEFEGEGYAIAVDNFAGESAEDVFVGTSERIERFNAAGEFLSELKLPGAGEIVSLAVDASENLYVLSSAIKGVRKLAPDGTPLYTVDAVGKPGSAGGPESVALDGSGHLIVVDLEKGPEVFRFIEFDAVSGTEVEVFGAGEIAGRPNGGPGYQGGVLSVGLKAARLYVASDTGGFRPSVAQSFPSPVPGPWLRGHSLFASEIGGSTATLNAILNAENRETKYHFEYVDDAKFKKSVEEHGAGHGFDEAVSTTEKSLPASFSEPTESEPIKGLKAETVYHLRVIAFNECEAGKECQAQTEEPTFETGPPVKIESLGASSVSSTSATLEAKMNPLGVPSSYRFEYLTEAEFQANVAGARDPFAGASRAPVPDGALGAGSHDLAISQTIADLHPGTIYRYRASAGNVGGEHRSEALALTTQTPGAFSLLDGREWEQVSPVEKHGALFESFAEAGVLQAAAQGNALTYLASTPTEPRPQGYSNQVQVLSARGPGGWSSLDLSLPQETAPGASIGEGQEYRFFSQDLSLALAQPFGAFVPSLSPEASEQTPFLRTDFLGGDSSKPCMSSSVPCYRPLISGCPPVEQTCSPVVAAHADVPPGTVFGVSESTLEACSVGPCGPLFRGATPDLSHVVFESPRIGLSGLPGDQGGLYEWANGKLALVSVLPSGEPAKGGPAEAPTLGHANRISRHAVSDDGSRVMWSFGPHLYERDMTLGSTVKLDLVQGGSGKEPPGAEAIFQAASSDGVTVYFTDQQQLTPGSTASEKNPDLYECEVFEESEKLHCKLSDLTPSGAVQGTVLGSSEDGSYVYFVADGVLAAGATPGTCANQGLLSEPGKSCDLYVRHAGVTKLIASLSGEDAPDWAPELNHLPARISPDGRWLAFMSQLPLTGYDNHDAHSGKPDEEVFLFDAAANGGEGSLVCASCDPTGARPVGAEYGEALTLSSGDRVWSTHAWLAANVPAWTAYQSGNALNQSRYLSDSGRLFFDSHDALVPQDTNGTEDVYEYEPPGAGSCTSGSAAFAAPSGGCIGLISSGSSAQESGFLDASETGADVFFLTAAKLSPGDRDTAIDVYDAHECTTASPCIAPPRSSATVCEGEACQAPVPPPSEVTPASMTFSGIGNLAPSLTASGPSKPKTLTRSQKLAAALKACHKKPKRKRARCERQARRAYGSRSQKSSSSSKPVRKKGAHS